MAQYWSRSEMNEEGESNVAILDEGHSTYGEESGGQPQRTCWICFATDRDNVLATWVQPCLCRGSTKWVHQSCLYRWIDEKQRGNAQRPVICQQCRAEYIIMFPSLNPIAAVLDLLDSAVKRSSPYVAAGIFVAAVCWTSVTYGAITVMQVMGQERGLAALEKAGPVLRLVGLPIIPMGLMMSRLVRWEDAVLRVIRNPNIMRKLPLINWVLSTPPAYSDENAVPRMLASGSSSDEPMYMSRAICGAILLPTFATLVGNTLFQSVEDNLHRTLLGGLTFILTKGLLKIYLRQKQYLRKTRRHIVDFTEENRLQYASADMIDSDDLGREEAGGEDTDEAASDEYLDIGNENFELIRHSHETAPENEESMLEQY